MKIKTQYTVVIFFTFLILISVRHEKVSALLYGSKTASEWPSATSTEILSRFNSYVELKADRISIPTVFEIEPFSEKMSSSHHLIVDEQTGERSIGYLSNTVTQSTIKTEVKSKEYELATDASSTTYASFPVDEAKKGITLSLYADKPLRSSEINLLFDKYVQQPETIELRAVADGREQVVVAKTAIKSTRFLFPETTAQKWVLTLTSTQQIRLSEVILEDSNAQTNFKNNLSLKLLAQPHHSYKVYIDPVRNFQADFSTILYQGPLLSSASKKEIKKVDISASYPNPLFREVDTDKDGVPDEKDNCPSIVNQGQSDEDGDGIGDPCDDRDFDGVINSLDNCIDKQNYDQRDIDGDGIGDVCDSSESRLTEQHKWLPWLGIGSAALVLIVLVAITAKDLRKPTV